MPEATVSPPSAARQAALARATRPLPLGRAGQGLRRRLREATESSRARLLASWASALDDLHAAGWGTEDPVAAAIVTVHDRVQLLPDLVWPLGTLTARRPVAAWLDTADAIAWLELAGLDRASMGRLANQPPPWPEWPRLPGPGPVAVIGPPAETAALAVAARIPWLPASDLATDTGRAWALEAIEARAVWIVPVASRDWLERLPTLPRQVTRARSVGASVSLARDELDALGIAPSLLSPATLGRSLALDRRALQSRLERAALAPDATGRARAEAAALLDALAAEGQAGTAPADATERYGAVIDLARAAGARDLQLRAAQGRGLSLAADADPERQRAGRADLVEARRLAAAIGEDAELVRADAAALLATALDGELRATPDPRPVDDVLARTWRRHAQLAAEATLDEGGALLGGATELFAAAMTTGSTFLVGATVELTGGAAIAHGREAEGERLLTAALEAGHPPALTPLLRAWSALLAARRGATTTARERLLEVATAVDVRDGLGTSGWLTRAAALGALAAAAIASDGLAAHLARHAPTSLRARLALREDLLDGLTGHPSWLLVIAADAALALPEARQRVARQLLLARLGRAAADAWPAGLALSFGRLSAATFFPDDARRGLELAAARGERHVERRALEALVPLLDGAPPETSGAATRRLAQLRAFELPPAPEDAPPLPLTPDAAARAQAALVHRAAEASAHAAPAERWRAAVESLCGPIAAAPPPPEHAADGLTLTLAEDGRWTLRTPDGHETRLDAAPREQPGPIARALTALAPAMTTEAGPEDGPDPRQAWGQRTHAALVAGEIGFEEAVITPFKRHDITRDQVRALLHIGLIEVGGLYTALADRWGVEPGAYQRALDFLRRANVSLDYRPYRRGSPPPAPWE